jgi:hypothetical protein
VIKYVAQVAHMGGKKFMQDYAMKTQRDHLEGLGAGKSTYSETSMYHF